MNNTTLNSNYNSDWPYNAKNERNINWKYFT